VDVDIFHLILIHKIPDNLLQQLKDKHKIFYPDYKLVVMDKKIDPVFHLYIPGNLNRMMDEGKDLYKRDYSTNNIS
jgi:hypothetical protein